MKYEAHSPEEYISLIPEDRKEAFSRLRQTLLDNLPAHFTEGIGYNMIGYVVPLSYYPQGYHCNPQQPLPFISLASQKNYIALYHMGLYREDLENWYKESYLNEFGKKPNMGKCCIRYTKMEDIPYTIIAQMAQKISADQWIEYYESVLNKNK